MSEAISMSGRVIGHLQVLDQAPSNGRRAMWWVRCADCRAEFLASGGNLRKAEARALYLTFPEPRTWQVVA